MPDNIASLLEHVRLAEGADRYVDYRIALAFVPGAKGHAGECDEGTFWVHEGGRDVLWTSEPYTASLDAALALVERVAPDRYWSINKIGGDPDFYSAKIADRPPYTGEALTPALALLAALLSSIQEEGEGNG